MAQTLQDYMEEHHGVCLSASEWDAVANRLIEATQEAEQVVA